MTRLMNEIWKKYPQIAEDGTPLPRNSDTEAMAYSQWANDDRGDSHGQG